MDYTTPCGTRPEAVEVRLESSRHPTLTAEAILAEVHPADNVPGARRRSAGPRAGHPNGIPMPLKRTASATLCLTAQWLWETAEQLCPKRMLDVSQCSGARLQRPQPTAPRCRRALQPLGHPQLGGGVPRQPPPRAVSRPAIW